MYIHDVYICIYDNAGKNHKQLTKFNINTGHPFFPPMTSQQSNFSLSLSLSLYATASTLAIYLTLI